MADLNHWVGTLRTLYLALRWAVMAATLLGCQEAAVQKAAEM